MPCVESTLLVILNHIFLEGGGWGVRETLSMALCCCHAPLCHLCMWNINCGAWHGARCSTRWAGSSSIVQPSLAHVFRCLHFLNQPHGGDGSDYWSVFRNSYTSLCTIDSSEFEQLQHYLFEFERGSGFTLSKTWWCPVVTCVQVFHFELWV